jgi:hypothetical protein
MRLGLGVHSKCRFCKEDQLQVKFDLGELKYTGVFTSYSDVVKSASLRLAICKSCTLVQLYDDLDPSEFYQAGYGYESNLNSSMKNHLIMTAEILEQIYAKKVGKVKTALDIASNDGTLLSGYKDQEIVKIGIDPLISFVNDRYPAQAIKINKFFSAKEVESSVDSSIDIVTSLSVFYDLTDPLAFAKDVAKVMAEDGIWFLEQSYLPSMIETNSYDTICHEHLNYYSLSILEKILSAAGLKIVSAETNNVNGGSIGILAVKQKNEFFEISPQVEELKELEIANGFLNEDCLLQFAENAGKHMNEFKTFLTNLKGRGYEIYGLGASTKGNVLLQCCGIDSRLMTSIGEVNPRKFGKVTPGTQIPIVNESEIISGDPKGKVIVIIPWHFQESILRKLQKFIDNGGEVVIPLPRIRLIKK